MDAACPLCGAALDEPAVASPGGAVRTCGSCGARVEARRVAVGRDAGEPDTVFQPRLLSDEAVESSPGTIAVRPETGILPGEPASRPHAGPEAYFLILGAPVGRERIPIRRACTVFDRAGCEVEEGAEPGAQRQFQVEVMGREFFLRDLDSGRPTHLNGRPVRYLELLPGDRVSAGETVLVFRTADDGLSRRGTP